MIQILASGAVLMCGWFYFSDFLTNEKARLSQLGLTCSVFTISMYLSPLFDLVHETHTSWSYRHKAQKVSSGDNVNMFFKHH